MEAFDDFTSDNAESARQRQLVEAEEAARALALLNKVPSMEENPEGTVIRPVDVDDTETATNDEEDEPYIGYRYDPEDEEFIQMLIRFIKGLKVGGNKVEEADLYSADPSVITEKWTPSIRKNTQQYLILTPRRRMGGETEQFHRNILGDKGYWEATGNRAYHVGPNGDIIGSSMNFRFCNGNLKNKVRGKRLTTWQMVEYSVCSELSISNPKNLAICKVFENDKSATAKAGVVAANAEQDQKTAMKLAAAAKMAVKNLSDKYEAAKKVETEKTLVAESSKSQATKKLAKRDKELKKAFETNEKENKLDAVRKEKEIARLAKKAAEKQKKGSTSGTGKKVNGNELCGACGAANSGTNGAVSSGTSGTVDEFWIFCEICRVWFHGVCVEVTETQAAEIGEYHCPSCAKEQLEGRNS